MSRQPSRTHHPTKAINRSWQENPVSIVPLYVQFALRDAIKAEHVSEADFSDLLWIMAQESAGVVNARNRASSARGLYQLLEAQYELNPRGAASFGDAREECQGGIRYIYGRYHSASAAKRFWQSHHWY